MAALLPLLARYLLPVLCLLAWLPMQVWAQAPEADPDPTHALQAAQQQRQARRAQIQAERQTLRAQRSKDEQACYQQFAVHDCLRNVRIKARAAENQLRREERQLDNDERHEKATDRRRSIEQRQQDQRQGEQSGARPPPMRATERGNAQTRDQLARQRAEQQQRHNAGHAADLQQRQQSEPERAAEARQRYDAKQQAARERREQLERDKAQAAASGRKPAAPLPEPSP